MSMTRVKIVHIANPTVFKEWKTRRINMMFRKLWKCCAFTEPSGIKGVYAEPFISPDGSIYVITIGFESWTKDEIDRFINFAKQVEIFHEVNLHFSPEHDTITT
jgi:hypothetical protein